MKKLLKILFGLVLTVLLLLAVGATIIAVRGIPDYEPQKIVLKVEVTPQRIEHGLKLAISLCIVCHSPINGNQLTGRQLTEIPPEFGKVYSANITKDAAHGIGKWTDGELVYFLRTGVKPNGKFAPIWMPKFKYMSDEDLFSIVAYLRSDHPTVQPSGAVSIPCEPSFLTKFLCQFAFKPLEYPKAPVITPDTADLITYGRYMVAGRYDCYPCHSADFKTVNMDEPEKTPGYLGGGNILINMEGKKIHSANITADEATGIGNWSFEQFSDAVRYGKKGDTGLRFPMLPYSRMEDIEVKAIWAYLHAVPKISNNVNRNLMD